MPSPRKVVLLGAGGRDFHNFNVFFRDNEEYRVVAIVQTQIPGLRARRYPPELAGRLYPEGVPVLPMSELRRIVAEEGVDEVVLSYSDLTGQEVLEALSEVLASGASFRILGPRDTMLRSARPVIAVTGVKTGVGKSTVSREVALELKGRGLRVGVVRHPMVYGGLDHPVQRFNTFEDLDKYGVTVEEREEYEPYIRMGFTVYAGIDYGRLLRIVEGESDVILWDGGNNDWPFFRPDFMLVVADAMRPGLEVGAFPGLVNLKMGDAVIINKADQAPPGGVEKIKENVRRHNPRASISVALSEVVVDRPELLEGRRALVIEDSPTVTHGMARYGAGYVAARKYGAEVVDPRPHATGFFRKIYDEYPHIGPVLPSTGYTKEQLEELAEIVRRVPADVVVLGTPSDLTKFIDFGKPAVRVAYRIKIVEGPTIGELVGQFLSRVQAS
ncbi:MAG: cyclic 2,3-diphosphoglycerate synthase [Desulfurococcaceae archaeon]